MRRVSLISTEKQPSIVKNQRQLESETSDYSPTVPNCSLRTYSTYRRDSCYINIAAHTDHSEVYQSVHPGDIMPLIELSTDLRKNTDVTKPHACMKTYTRIVW